MDNNEIDDDFVNGLDLLIPDVRGRSEILYTIASELEKESDRGCALVAAAYLENEITVLLKRFLVKQSKKAAIELFDFNGPIGTFSSKIKLSFALGLISKELQSSLDVIRKIRNDFAHLHEPLDFSIDTITQKINSLLPSCDISVTAPREKFLKKALAMVAAIHLSLANTTNRNEFEHENVPLMDSQVDHELEIAARQMMKISAPEITYEQALDLVKKIKEIK